MYWSSFHRIKSPLQLEVNEFEKKHPRKVHAVLTQYNRISFVLEACKFVKTFISLSLMSRYYLMTKQVVTNREVNSVAFIFCLFITAKVSKLTTVGIRISESLLTDVIGRSKCMAKHKWAMCTSRTSDNTKVPDFSSFGLRKIKTWKTEQLGWNRRCWSSFPSASKVRHMYKMMYSSEIFSGSWFKVRCFMH